jgi:hypothetical protein
MRCRIYRMLQPERPKKHNLGTRLYDDCLMPKQTSPLRNIVTDKQLSELARLLREQAFLLSQKNVTIGFDGFLDSIVKLVEKRPAGKAPEYFSTIEAFGQHILHKKSASFAVETETRSVKIGGNMPITANAMGRFGINVNCLGALGYPQVHECFTQLPATCKLFTFTQPGTATALEFNDGKIMMADMAELHHTDWEKIKTRIPLAEIKRLFATSDMIALLNWSEIDASTSIWEGLLTEVIPAYDAPGQHLFLDLSDCSNRSESTIKKALALIDEFAKTRRVTLSLNRNEAGILLNALAGNSHETPIQQIAGSIFGRMNIETLLVHTSKEAAVVTRKEQFSLPTFYIPEPVLSTGAGDNFNAGFCTGLLLGFDMISALILANAVSGYYVRNGKSGGLNDIIDFLETYQTR